MSARDPKRGATAARGTAGRSAVPSPGTSRSSSFPRARAAAGVTKPTAGCTSAGLAAKGGVSDGGSGATAAGSAVAATEFAVLADELLEEELLGMKTANFRYNFDDDLSDSDALRDSSGTTALIDG